MNSFLSRWQILGAQDIGEDPYLDRLRLVVTPWFAVYLHHIRRKDKTPAHDHPWWFASVVLTGSYTELVWPDKHDSDRVVFRHHRRGSLHTMRLKARHRITHVDKPLWTLVLTGIPKNLEWGFYPDSRVVPWYDYEEREDIVAGWPSWKQRGVIK